jgi:aryl-alcohol dehydrogenase-like predicted oxidoreductase
MEYIRLGSTGLKISRLALGRMSYGDPTTPNAHEWSLREEDAQPYFRQAVVPYSPQGKGRLARPGASRASAPPSTRSSGLSTLPTTSRWSTRCNASPRRDARPWHKSRSPGC